MGHKEPESLIRVGHRETSAGLGTLKATRGLGAQTWQRTLNHRADQTKHVVGRTGREIAQKLAGVMIRATNDLVCIVRGEEVLRPT